MQAPRGKPLTPPPRVAVICGLSSAFGRDVTLGVTRYANLRRKWDLRIDTWQGEPLDRLPPCEGAIVAGVGAEVFELVRGRCGCVVHCTGEGDTPDCPDVSVDDWAVGEMAARYLLDCRLTNFAYHGWPETGAGFDRHRYEGFARVLREHGHDCPICPYPWPSWSARLTHEHHPRLSAWIESLPKPVGIFAVDDVNAHDLAAVCLGARIPVPEQVAIVGVNDDQLLCESAWPRLTSVACDFTRVGYEAGKMLEKMLAGEALRGEDRWVKLPPMGITERQSTSVFAVDQPEVARALQFIREHACDPCGVSDILEHVPVGRRWLEKQFRTHLGRTPHGEIMRVRMETASRLLLEPDVPMASVARRSGFAAVQSFTKAFREAKGTTPAVYRRERLRRSG